MILGLNGTFVLEIAVTRPVPSDGDPKTDIAFSPSCTDLRGYFEAYSILDLGFVSNTSVVE
jgi:hypothetical protein